MKYSFYKEVITRIIRIFDMPDISRRRQIILLVLRILAIIGIMTFFVMWLVVARHAAYIAWFFGGLAIICFIVPELTAELLVRDFPSKGVFNIPHKIRLMLTPVLYGIAYAASPILFHSFFKLFAERNCSMGGNISSLQIGLWHTLFNPPSYGPFATWILMIVFSILLATSIAICYLMLSASWRRRFAAVTAFVTLEAAAALSAVNFPD